MSEVDADAIRAELLADLGGLNEVAAALGVPLDRARRWVELRKKTYCPAPVKKLKYMHLYSINEWQGWHAVWKVTRGSETWWTAKYD